MSKSSNDTKHPSDTVTKVKENNTELDDVPINNEEKPADVEESLKKSIEAYRNVRIGTKELSEKELEKIDKECKIIEDREVISKNLEQHLLK